jgi:hypothetical protein
MRAVIIYIFLACLIGACKQNSGTDRPDNTPEKNIRKQVLSIAEKYSMGQLKNGKKTLRKDGTIVLRDSQKIYVINPAKIFIGLIDNDAKKDAIVSIDAYLKEYFDHTEYLILLKTNGKLVLTKEIESDMKILKVQDGIITAQIHTRPRNSPLYDCSACMEVVKYQYKNGDLVKIQ